MIERRWIVNGEARTVRFAPLARLLDPDTRVLTAEGLEASELGRSLKQAFERQGAVQCGYCSPAMLVGGYALLSRDPDPGEAQIRAGLAGHLCRCTGYASIVKAVQETAAKGVGR
jgi:aerobic-type carbon monoxide dehydrogenase small subunit (CoxS/CutS family)